MTKNLYDTLAQRWCKGGTVYVYSDPHFSDEEMNHLRKNYIGDNEQLKRINSKVGKNDTIIFLGDIGNAEIIKKIKGYKILIMGNHEKGASNYLRKTFCNVVFPKINNLKYTYEYLPENKHDEYISYFGELIKKYGYSDKLEHICTYEDNHLFDEVYEGPLMVNDRLILSHEPIENLPKYLFNIHGHDHSKWYEAENALNVCAEHIDYRPVNVLNLLKTGLLKNVLHIHRVTINAADKRKNKKKGSYS